MARNIIQALYPNNQSIVIVNHTHDNIVGLVDKNYVIRFPRDKNSYLRSLHERYIINKLSPATTLTIPHIINENHNPPYIITNMLAGHHISPAVMRTFTLDQQREVGKSIARFTYTMHSTIPLKDEILLRKELELDDLIDNEPWPIYYQKVIGNITFPTKTQDTLAKDCFNNWLQQCHVNPSVVVHDDLHSENIMFENKQITGIIDFGDTTIGTPEQELRQLYRINENILLAGVNEYQNLSGIRLNIEAIKIWAVMKELADYIKAYKNQNTKHHSFIRSCRNLNRWLPTGEWGIDYDLTQFKGYQ